MSDLICTKCNIALKSTITKFDYMNREMQSEVLRCPECGQVYLSEELVEDKIRHIEESLEDK